MDKGRQIDNLYLINGHFTECVKSIVNPTDEKAFGMDRMRIIFTDEAKKYAVNKLNALDYVHIHFQSEWPLEIIMDKDTIKKYNQVLSFLMKIKRVNYLLSLRDYWLKPCLSVKKAGDITIKEHIAH